MDNAVARILNAWNDAPGASRAHLSGSSPAENYGRPLPSRREHSLLHDDIAFATTCRALLCPPPSRHFLCYLSAGVCLASATSRVPLLQACLFSVPGASLCADEVMGRKVFLVGLKKKAWLPPTFIPPLCAWNRTCFFCCIKHLGLSDQGVAVVKLAGAWRMALCHGAVLL